MGSIGTAPAANRKHAAPKVRADATRNRERIISAAREAFVIHGADAPLDEIARHAGIGNATLYRHFPDRDALVRGVVLAVTDRIATRARTAIQEATAEAGGGGDGAAFEAVRRFVFGAVEERVGALCPMLSARFDKADPELLAARQRLEGLVEELIDRAQRAGELRPDVAVGDLMVALSQLTRPLPGSGCAEIGRFVDRHLQLFLDGLRAPARSTLPGHAATLEELRKGS
ncbi:TetR/AcrR family transcriptional regulator [Streptomyces sp. NPDC054796]